MNELSKESATWHEVGDEGGGQRVDNYLTRLLKGVPKSHIYRILRSGEVRVNSRRVGPEYRVQAGDRVRVPPIRTSHRAGPRSGPPPRPLGATVLFEDDWMLAIDKPAGAAVHGGSGVSHGIIEQLRRERPHARFLELVHRLDRETSGVLLLAKRRSALVELHRQLREGRVQKHYLVLVRGAWQEGKRSVRLPLEKSVTSSGERRVSVRSSGAPAHTVFRLARRLNGYTLLEAELKTGCTHQIRVHLAHLGFPIAGDDKYGDFALNRELARVGLKRMFLHASTTAFVHPRTGDTVSLTSTLPVELAGFLTAMAGRGDAGTI
jgi:23S rRNA pseudouridine955/2504/2580 synthase